MTTFVVLTIIGEDEPGVVESLARTVALHDGNWLESRMSHLAGKFAGVLRVSAPKAKLKPLMAALSAMESKTLQITATLSDATEQTEPSVTMELVGSDHPGIVRDISAALASLGVNVEELETATEPAPMAGGKLFRARAALRLPEGLDVEDVRVSVESVAHDMMVDFPDTDDSPRGVALRLV